MATAGRKDDFLPQAPNFHTIALKSHASKWQAHCVDAEIVQGREVSIAIAAPMIVKGLWPSSQSELILLLLY